MQRRYHQHRGALIEMPDRQACTTTADPTGGQAKLPHPAQAGSAPRGTRVPGDRGVSKLTGGWEDRLQVDVPTRRSEWSGYRTWHRYRDMGVRVSRPIGHPTTDGRRKLTDHITPHYQDDELFRTAGQADEQQASDVTEVKPVSRPSRDLFPHAVNHRAAEERRPETQRDEEAMRSLRFPFDKDNCR